MRHVIEPTRLLLCWQSRQKDKKSYLIGEVTIQDEDLRLKYYLDSPDFAEAQAQHCVGMAAFPPHKEPPEGFTGVKTVLMRRTHPRKRKDFPQYLEQHRLAFYPNISDFALLGYTQARLPEDGIFLVHPFDEECGPLELMLEIVHVPTHLPAIQEKSTLELLEVKQDQIDVCFQDEKIGQINHCQTAQFQFWKRSNCEIHAFIDRINTDDIHPRVFVFIEIMPLSTEL